MVDEGLVVRHGKGATMGDDSDDADELYIPEEWFWPWLAACVLIARDGVTAPPVKGAQWGHWFRHTVAPDRAAALIAEVRLMGEEERGMWVMRALGGYDA